MSLKNLFKRGAQLGWMPDVDSVNAPDGALLRADNLVPDEIGALALRRGSSTLYSGLVGGDQATGVHSLYSTTLPNPNPDGTLYTFAASGEKVYENGVDLGTRMDGTEDVAFGDDAYQVFFARGKSKYKFDGDHLNNWSIAAPEGAPTLTAGTVISDTFVTFASGESPALTIHEGTSSFQTGHTGVASSCLELTPAAANGRASVSKVFASDQNLFNVKGADGGDDDLIDFYIWLEEPRKVDGITIMFGLNTGSDPFMDDRYEFTFDINNNSVVNIKDQASTGAAAYTTAVNLSQSVLTPEDVTNVKTPDQVKEVLARLGRFAGAQSNVRQDAQQNSPAWTHLTVSRGQLSRIGGTAGRDWTTVRGIKVVYTAVPGSTEKVRFDDLIIIGGGDRILTGTYKACYRFVRDTGNYIELSPISPISDEITLNGQALVVTLPATSISAADAQVNQVWIYLFGGFLDTWYRFSITGSTNSNTMGIDEFDPSPDGSVDAADRTRLLNPGLSIPGFTPNSNVAVTIRKSELDAIIENEVLEPGAVGVPDDIVAIAGPWHNRMFLVTDEGWVYPTSQTSPSNCSVYHALDLRRYGDPLWAVKTNGGIYVGCTKDVIQIGGTGDESTDRISVDLFPQPLNVGNPPADRAVFTDGNTVVYRSVDGLMSLSGVSLTPVSQGKTTLLWRGYDRYGQAGLNINTGRFRLAVDNQILYFLATEGTGTNPTAIWRYNTYLSQWSRTTYPSIIYSIRRAPDGRLLAGTADGAVLQLEVGQQDSGVSTEVDLLTPWMDGGEPLNRKVPFDFQIHTNTSGSTGVLDVFVDGAVTPAASYNFSTTKNDIYRLDVTALPYFTKAQFGISGSFDLLVIDAINASYRSLAQQTMVLDTGYVIPADPGDLAWFSEVEADCISPVDLNCEVYLDDALYTTQSVTVTPNIRYVYRVPLPRGTKGRRPRVLLRTTNANGAGDRGFECFRIRLRTRSTGNQTEVPYITVYPAGSDE